MRAPRIVGLDLSLTATGICYRDSSTGTVRTRTQDGDRRLTLIKQHVHTAIGGRSAGFTAPAVDLVVIEDLPTHAKAAGITGMVHGAVRSLLIERGIPYALVTPATVKKYATGKGNCGKALMATAALKRTKGARDFGDDDNECDAWWLWAAAMEHYGTPVVELPHAQRAALDKVAWPELVAT